MIDKKLKEKINSLPYKTGVYLFKDENGKVIYAGKANSLKKRVLSYLNRNSLKNRLILSKAKDIEFFITNNEVEALLLEYSIIKKHRPEFNIQLKDDKSYPYILIDLEEEFPGIYFVRKKKSKKRVYFGPYPSSKSVKRIIETVEKLFKLKTCKYNISKLTRPCLKYQIGRCMAPCIHKAKEEYKKNVLMAIKFLKGETKNLVSELESEMQKASSNLEFEKAAKLRDTIFAIKKIETDQGIFLNTDDCDLVYYTERENKHHILILFIRGNRVVEKKEFLYNQTTFESPSHFLSLYIASLRSPVKSILTNFSIMDQKTLEEAFFKRFRKKITLKNISKSKKFRQVLLIAGQNAEYSLNLEGKNEEYLINLKKLLNLKKIPEKIYGFDISHLSSYFTVASSVCFKNGKPEKSLYRRIKLTEGINNDYLSIYLAVIKRLKSDFKRGIDPPDLIIIDGGKGQLAYAKKALQKLGLSEDIEVISIAKKEEKVFSDNLPEGMKLDFYNPVSSIITRVRNESHRFANEYRNCLYRKKNLISLLIEIPGIGKKTAIKLLKRFGSIENIINASNEEVEKTINKKMAMMIKSTLKNIYFKN